MDRLAALEEAIRMMGLDPIKVAQYVSEPENACCKAILFASIGIDDARLKMRAPGADPNTWRDALEKLR